MIDAVCLGSLCFLALLVIVLGACSVSGDAERDSLEIERRMRNDSKE